MSQDTPAFFTLDRGTASTAAALIAPVDGRYRMLASASAPVAIEPESILEDLAWRVARTDATLAGSMDGWRDWSRLEVHTGRAPRAVLVAASADSGALLERAFVGAGWAIASTFFGAAPDIVAFGEACLDPRLDAVVMGGRDAVDDEEQQAAYQLWPRVGALARFRHDLAVIACGPFAERPEGISEGRLFALPAPDPVPLTSDSLLRTAAEQVGVHLVEQGDPTPPEGRIALRASVASLAGILGHRVDGIDVGLGASSRTTAHEGGETGHAIIAAAGLLPAAILDDDELGESLLRWSALPGNPAARLDGLRDLALRPWTDVDADGLHLRMAALRSALERLDAAWSVGAPTDDPATAGSLVLAGGVFSALPPAAAALAAVDGVRRSGALSILHDHASILAPLGALPVEDDRRRLLGDLMGDGLLPLGSALLTGTIAQPGKKDRGASLGISSVLGDQHLRLDPGLLQQVDLPPGVVASIDIEPGDVPVLGAEGRRLTMEMRGGLGGLLVDTRPIPLELPDAGEQRRAALEAWEAPAWAVTAR